MLFNHVFNYSRKRNIKQAFVFYFTHIILLVMIAFVFEFLRGLAPKQAYEGWSQDSVGTSIAMFFSLLIFFLILFKKKQWRNMRYIVLIIVSGSLTYLGGGILGLIPVAYMSTVVNNNEIKQVP